MSIVIDFSREATQFLATKKPSIPFNIEESAECKMGECCSYKFCMQLEEANSPIYLLTIEVFELTYPKEWFIFKRQLKQVLKGKNINNVDIAYTLVHDLLKGNTLVAFNNKQDTLEKPTPDNLVKCLDDIM
eukprot:5402170-Ditylum_brightwellii.AAC.1